MGKQRNNAAPVEDGKKKKKAEKPKKARTHVKGYTDVNNRARRIEKEVKRVMKKMAEKLDSLSKAQIHKLEKNAQAFKKLTVPHDLAKLPALVESATQGFKRAAKLKDLLNTFPMRQVA